MYDSYYDDDDMAQLRRYVYICVIGSVLFTITFLMKFYSIDKNVGENSHDFYCCSSNSLRARRYTPVNSSKNSIVTENRNGVRSLQFYELQFSGIPVTLSVNPVEENDDGFYNCSSCPLKTQHYTVANSSENSIATENKNKIPSLQLHEEYFSSENFGDIITIDVPDDWVLIYSS